MDLRKVQKTGGSTFIVSLPKDWAVHHGIQAGDTLAILRQQDGSLAVSPSGERRDEPRLRQITVDERSFEALAREVIASYLAGYDVLEIKARDRLPTEMREGLRQLTRKIIGPEIVDESADTLVVQDLLDPAHLPLRKGVQRMYFITRSMHKDAVNALLTGDGDLARDVEGRDDDVDRLFWMVTKQYNLVLQDVREGDRIGASPSEGLDYLLVARILERIGDHAFRIAQQTHELSPDALADLEDDIRGGSDRTVAILEDAYRAFEAGDTARANRAIADVASLEGAYESLLERGVTLPGRDAVHFAYVLESLVRTAGYATDIAEVAINHAVAHEEDGG